MAADTDVVISCTSSHSPVYTQAAQAGRLVIAVGSFNPAWAEIGADTVRASGVLVDDETGAAHEAGDLIQAGIDMARVQGLARVLGQPAPSGPVVFKTVGCAAWDLAAARVALAMLAAK